MNFRRGIPLLALSFLFVAGTALSQEGTSPRPGGGGTGQAPGDRKGEPGGRPPHPPIETALDANGDGIIDAGEIANAPAALKKLDKNGDGKLSPEEYRPP